MENKKKIYIAGIILVIGIIILTLFFIQTNEEQNTFPFFQKGIIEKVEETITYTDSTRMTCNGEGKCSIAIYSGVRYAKNSSSDWVDVGDVVRITKNSDDITFHYDGIIGYFNMTFETGVIHNGNYYSMVEVKQMYPEIQFSFPLNNRTDGKKHSVNITNIPINIQLGLENITLTYKDHYGFNLSQLKTQRGRMIIGQIMEWSFDDLYEEGYTTKINLAERRLYIGNLTIINDGLYLDPFVTLITADSENMDDTFVDKFGNDRQAGSATVMRFLANVARTSHIVTKWNISAIPAGQQIDEANLSFFVVSNSIDAGEGMDLEPHYVQPFPTYNITNNSETHEWTEGNSTSAGIGANFGGLCVENMICWDKMPNLTTEMNATADSTLAVDNVFPAGGAHFNITVTGVIAEGYGNGDINVTIFVNATNNNGLEIFDSINPRAKEIGGTSADPILHITFSALAPADNPPEVTLSIPPDGTSNTSTEFTFGCNVTDDINISSTNLTVWFANDSKIFNSSINISTDDTSFNYTFFNEDFIVGNYSWNCLATDNATQTAWADANFSLNVTAVAVDTCTPDSPLTDNYLYECSDNCDISSDVDASKFNITINGTGSFVLNANITNYDTVTILGQSSSLMCDVFCFDGCFIG